MNWIIEHWFIEAVVTIAAALVLVLILVRVFDNNGK